MSLSLSFFLSFFLSVSFFLSFFDYGPNSPNNHIITLSIGTPVPITMLSLQLTIPRELCCPSLRIYMWTMTFSDPTLRAIPSPDREMALENSKPNKDVDMSIN